MGQCFHRLLLEPPVSAAGAEERVFEIWIEKFDSRRMIPFCQGGKIGLDAFRSFPSVSFSKATKNY